MFEAITNIFPVKIRNHFNTLLIYSRMKVNKKTFLGFFLVLSLGISLFMAILIAIISDFGFFLTFLISFIVLIFGAYFTFSLRADAVARDIENVLPDALQLMTSNLRAGLTTDKALLLSVRPEFGVLSEELDKVGKKLALGGNIQEAMLEMVDRIKSERFRKTVTLIVSGLRSGGELSDLLDQLVSNLRHERFVDERIRTNVLMYAIFIFVAIGIGAPMLFGLSSFLISVLQENLAQIDIPETASVPITLSEINISTSFIMFFVILSLITTSVLGSLVLGLITKGQEKRGIKFIPMLITLSLIIFFLSRFLVKTLLSGLFGV